MRSYQFLDLSLSLSFSLSSAFVSASLLSRELLIPLRGRLAGFHGVISKSPLLKWEIRRLAEQKPVSLSVSGEERRGKEESFQTPFHKYSEDAKEGLIALYVFALVLHTSTRAPRKHRFRTIISPRYIFPSKESINI